MEKPIGKNPLKRSLIVGIIFLFLSTTCIPAIQLNISNSAKQQFPSDLKTETQTPKTKYILELPEKHPLLFLFVVSVLYFREFRCNLLFKIATEPDTEAPGWETVFPILFFKWFILSVRTFEWNRFWTFVSNYFGWGWTDENKSGELK